MRDHGFTEADLRAVFHLDSIDARRHACCGPSARCRREALAKCDEDLDAYLALSSQRAQEAQPRHPVSERQDTPTSS